MHRMLWRYKLGCAGQLSSPSASNFSMTKSAKHADASRLPYSFLSNLSTTSVLRPIFARRLSNSGGGSQHTSSFSSTCQYALVASMIMVG